MDPPPPRRDQPLARASTTGADGRTVRNSDDPARLACDRSAAASPPARQASGRRPAARSSSAPRAGPARVRPRTSAPSTRAATVRAPSGLRARTARRALRRCGRSPPPAAAAGWAGGPSPGTPRTASHASTRPESPQTAIANTPPGRSALAQSRSVDSGDGTWLKMKARVTTSKSPSGKGSVGAPATSQRGAASGRSRCASRIIAGSGSTAVTTAPRRVAAAASRPVPEPTSRTSLLSSRRRSATASSSGSKTPPQVSAKVRS